MGHDSDMEYLALLHFGVMKKESEIYKKYVKEASTCSRCNVPTKKVSIYEVLLNFNIDAYGTGNPLVYQCDKCGVLIFI